MSSLEFSDRASIEAHQLDALNRILRECGESNAFYRSRLADAGVADGVESLGEFVAQCALTTKDELAEDQRQHPPYGTNLTYPLERYTRLHQTSSTTGRPLRWLDTSDDWSWMLDGWEMVLRSAGVSASDRAFAAFSFGPFIGFWLAFDAACRMGCLTIPGGALSSAMRLRVILENDVTVLLCTPTYALRLAEVAAAEGIDLTRSSVRVILVAGEPGGSIPATRAKIERAWPGARVSDHHGMTEVGPVTFECPDHPGRLHVNELAYLAEVVACSRAGDDAIGELVLTTLGRVGSPVFRYRTGDAVRVRRDRGCSCGRYFMSFEGGITARLDDMVFVRGMNLYPSVVEQSIRNCDGVAEYRCEIDESGAMTEVHVLIEASTSADAGELQTTVGEALRRACGIRLPVRVVESGALPRFELKAKRWLRRDGNATT